jgi:hypothetical protein
MVSSEVHINERRVSEPVWEDKGKATVPESENEKDPKRACLVLSKGHEVVGPGYPRLLGDATRVVDGGEVLGNPNRVDQARQEYDMDWWADRVTRDSRGNQDGGSGQQADRITQVSQGNQGSNPKSGNSTWVTENSAKTESRVMENSATMESRGMENSANTESRVTDNSANMES